jgi:hypothetical protein
VCVRDWGFELRASSYKAGTLLLELPLQSKHFLYFFSQLGLREYSLLFRSLGSVTFEMRKIDCSGFVLLLQSPVNSVSSEGLSHPFHLDLGGPLGALSSDYQREASTGPLRIDKLRVSPGLNFR